MPANPVIECTWDQLGDIRHAVRNGNGSEQQDLLLLLAPSLPMLLSHQLGAVRPSHGLILCQDVVDLFEGRRYLRLPINSALTGVSITLVHTRKAWTLQFSPKHGPLANNDSLEEGARQFVHNYMLHVASRLSGETRLIVRALTASVVDHYVKLLADELGAMRIGPSRDKWSPRLATDAAEGTSVVAQMYGPTFPEGTDLDAVDATYRELLPDMEARLSRVLRGMGITQ